MLREIKKRKRKQMFSFDLQLFGGGGDGKSTGKLIGSIALGVLAGGTGFGWTGWFSKTSWLTNFVMGASLFSSIWSATHRPDASEHASIQRFDMAQETMSSDGMLPVVYGERKVSGNQTYHKPESDAKTLYKHVVLCEGGIEGISGLTANELLIPTGSQTSNTVFTLRNIKYEDATASLSNQHLNLNCNGKSRSVFLCTTDDLSSDAVYYDYQVNINSLISYINRLGEGWQAFPVASTSVYPGKLYEFSSSNVYNNPVNVCAATVTGGTTYTFYDCSTSSTYKETGAYTDMAWLDMKFVVADELSGNPQVACLVKGRKVYDPRDGETRYSTNPALCLRDFMLSKRYGLGQWFSEEDLDTDSWIEAADYCDEEIQFYAGNGTITSGKRYELNMIIDEKRSAIEWLQEILANFAGYLVYSQGKIKLKIEKVTPVSYVFNDDNMSDLKIEPLKMSETPNRYNVTFIDPLNNWKSIVAVCEDLADQKERGKVISKDVSLEGVTSQNQALRLARFYRDYNLVCPMQVSFSTGVQAMHLEPGDVVTISYHGVFEGMPIRIAEIKETNKGTFEISGRQYNDTIYTDEVGGGIHYYNYSTMSNPYTGDIPNPYNIVVEEENYVTLDGSRVSHANLTWQKPQCDFFSRYIVEYSMDNGESWNMAGYCFDENYTMNVVIGKEYTFRVKTENTVGRRSSGVVSQKIGITGYNAPPSDVTGLTFKYIKNGVVLSWDNNPEPDIRGYNIYQGEGECGYELCDLVIENNSSNSVIIPLEFAVPYTFYVRAVDTVGNMSSQPAMAFVPTLEIPLVTGFFVIKNGDTLQCFWDSIDGLNYEIRWGTSWEGGKVIARVNANVYTAFFPLVGTHTFWIKAFNGENLYSKSASMATVNFTPAADRNIIAKFDEKARGWVGVKNGLTIDSDNLVTNDGNGEYYTYISLNKEVDARNWIEYKAGYKQDDKAWADLSIPWYECEDTWDLMANSEYVTLNNYITTYVGLSPEVLYGFDLNGNTKGASDTSGITYGEGRFRQGVLVQDKTVLDYNVSMPETYNIAFNAKHHAAINGYIVYMTLENVGGWLRLEYNNGIFALVDHNNQRVEIEMTNYSSDTLLFYIKQTANERTLRVTSIGNNKVREETKPFTPIGGFNKMRFRA